ncbi:ribose 5-phosphate isomerase A [Caldisphaera sp.]|uniref:ribose 5-phosphate isomerase A n=1 Tax=Caldisphaera sp. TaxID=2060322 RepID=UPI003D131355
MQCDAKREAAKGALELAKKFISNYKIVGLGTGSTTQAFIKESVDLLMNKKLISSSSSTSLFLSSLGLEAIEYNQKDSYIYIDGADEVTRQGEMIKGRGAALLGEKILAYSGSINIFVVSEEKLVNKLGEKRPVPIEVVPKAYPYISNILKKKNIKYEIRQCQAKDGPIISDWGGFIIDVYTGPMDEPKYYDDMLRSIPGVVETGIFLNLADYIVIGRESCGYDVIELKRKSKDI